MVGEIKEKLGENTRADEYFAELPFDGKKEWNMQFLELVKKSMKDRYKGKFSDEYLESLTTKVIPEITPTLFAMITTDRDYAKFTDNLDDITKIKIFRDTDGAYKIEAQDEDGDIVAVFESIAPAMKELVGKKYECDRASCHRRSAVERGYSVFRRSRQMPVAQRLAICSAMTPERSPQQALGDQKPPETPEQKEYNRRVTALISHYAEKREQLITVAQNAHDEEGMQLERRVIPEIADLGADELNRVWSSIDGAQAVDELFKEDPGSGFSPDAHDRDKRLHFAGYRFNPFQQLKWNHRTLLDAIQGHCFINFNDNGKISFQDIADEIYQDRFDDFAQFLKSNKVSDEVIGLLDKKDIIKSHKKFQELNLKLQAATKEADLPEDLRKFYKGKNAVAFVTQVLGDYVVYAHRLVNLIGDLRWQPAWETQRRNPTIFEIDNEKNPAARNVKLALHEVFINGIDSNATYTSELAYWIDNVRDFLSGDKKSIPFDDLNGKTATVRADWFNDYLSPWVAYELAYDAAQEVGTNEKGEDITVINEDKAVAELNDMLQLGIHAYKAIPGDRSLKEIFDGLIEHNAYVGPGQPLVYRVEPADSRNLFAVLKLQNLGQLSKKDSELEKKIVEERTKFIRIGAAVKQNMKVEGQEREYGAGKEKTIEEAKKTAQRIKLTEEQTTWMIEELKKVNAATPQQLEKLRSEFIGGGVVVSAGQGGGFTMSYGFESGTSLHITGFFPQWNSFAPGLSIGQKIPVTADLEITIIAGAVGDIPAGGLRITQKGKSADAYIEAGASFKAGVIPAAFVGAGISWARHQEKFEEKYEAKVVKLHLKELRALSPAARYTEVVNNRTKYPEFAALVDEVKNVTDLSEQSKVDLFNSLFEFYDQGIAFDALKESAPMSLVPTGFGVGLAYVTIAGLPVPVPYVHFDLPLGIPGLTSGRKLVYRIAVGEKIAEQVSDDKALAAINEAEKGGVTKIEPKVLATSTELTRDPETGRLCLTRSRSSEMDFSFHNENFLQVQKILRDNADIFVSPAHVDGKNMGLLMFTPHKANGPVQVVIDPHVLADDVITMTHKADGRLFLSVKKDKKLYIKRQDIHYPFPISSYEKEKDGEKKEEQYSEVTRIVITDNPQMGYDEVRDLSAWYLEKQPWSGYVKRPAPGNGVTPDERQRQAQHNFKTLDEYKAWYGAGKADRLEYVSLEKYKKSHQRLSDAVTIRERTEWGDTGVRTEVLDAITRLTKKEGFIEQYRDLATKGYEYILKNGKIAPVMHENFQELSALVEAEIRVDLKIPELEMSNDELNEALNALMVESFLDLHKREPALAQKEYERQLEAFERPLLMSIARDYYKDQGSQEVEKQSTDLVNWIIAKLKNVKLTDAAREIKGAYFMTTAGMRGTGGPVVGVRRSFNFKEGRSDYGLIGIPDVLKDNATDPMAKKARLFWLRELSPYRAKSYEGELSKTETQKTLREALDSPLALKMLPLYSVMLKPEEMEKLYALYDNAGGKELPPVTAENFETVKKFLEVCEKVRQAQLDNLDKVPLSDPRFTILINTNVEMGVYKRCGNASGLMTEQFGLAYTGGQQPLLYAVKSDAWVGVQANYTRVDHTVMAGFAFPVISEKPVGNFDTHRHEDYSNPDNPQPTTTTTTQGKINLPGTSPDPTSVDAAA